jgi:hypothetical protein
MRARFQPPTLLAGAVVVFTSVFASPARADSVAVIQLRTESRPRLDAASIAAVLSGVRQATSDTTAKYIAEWPGTASRSAGGTGSGILREAEKALRSATTLDYRYPLHEGRLG